MKEFKAWVVVLNNINTDFIFRTKREARNFILDIETNYDGTPKTVRGSDYRIIKVRISEY